MTDPVAAAKLFSEHDYQDGRQEPLKKVDFRTTGFFFPDKKFSSITEA
jgi:hypothetical protein